MADEQVKAPTELAAEKAAAKKAAQEKAAAEKAEQVAAAKKAAQEQTDKKKTDPYRELVKEYAKLYPSNKTFHVTSDKQVFLSNGLSAATNHQKSLQEGKVQTITID